MRTTDIDGMNGAYLGPEFSQAEIQAAARSRRRFEVADDDELVARTVDALAERARRSAGSRAAWSSGRARSATARSWPTRARPRCRSMLNLKVKYRESFRPFAPVGAARGRCRLVRDGRRQPLHAAVSPTWSNAGACHDHAEQESVRHRQAQRAALRHSGGHPRRLFGAHPDRAPRDQSALSRADFALQGRTGCPVLVNTSFNVRGEPIVCTPEDAFRCFMGTEIDAARDRQLSGAQGATRTPRFVSTIATPSIRIE